MGGTLINKGQPTAKIPFRVTLGKTRRNGSERIIRPAEADAARPINSKLYNKLNTSGKFKSNVESQHFLTPMSENYAIFLINARSTSYNNMRNLLVEQDSFTS